jgi:tubulin-specific chaperone C
VSVETSAIRGDALKNCVVYTGPIYGSLWLEHCQHCEFFVACRQLRVHHSSLASFHLRIASHPIIEDCHQLRFGAYRLHYAGLDELLERFGLPRDNGLWSKVNDFKWHKTQQSPNWSVWDLKQPLRAIPEALQSRLRYE